MHHHPLIPVSLLLYLAEHKLSSRSCRKSSVMYGAAFEEKLQVAISAAKTQLKKKKHHHQPEFDNPLRSLPAYSCSHILLLLCCAFLNTGQ